MYMLLFTSINVIYKVITIMCHNIASIEEMIPLFISCNAREKAFLLRKYLLYLQFCLVLSYYVLLQNEITIQLLFYLNLLYHSYSIFSKGISGLPKTSFYFISSRAQRGTASNLLPLLAHFHSLFTCLVIAVDSHLYQHHSRYNLFTCSYLQL